eukprot:CAMPEP_0118932252 /NCGR_PEP_ID=MMETSP1169-20130426/9611_1 /TAXON_ID=36882 /ORGANISM="Pyramimonas obovata, Strain CCMP722" /LENGTH=72 /DNA_ID=CAMNT_0006874879 /DNA_START=87 /DNA_END=305 /DNA_ORIENTATION=+
MVRGKAKADSQARNAKKHEAPKGSQLDAIKNSQKSVCPICKTPIAAKKVLEDHYASKHPKEQIPADYLGLLK